MKSRRPFLPALAVAALIGAAAPAAQPSGEQVVPLIEMDDVALTDAIRQIARMARLNILLDPRLSAPPFEGTTVSFRWQHVTAKEALTALLDNYDLVLVETPRFSASVNPQ